MSKEKNCRLLVVLLCVFLAEQMNRKEEKVCMDFSVIVCTTSLINKQGMGMYRMLEWLDFLEFFRIDS